MPASETTLILSIETATRAGSIALSRGARISASCSGEALASHSNTLLREVEALLKSSGRTLEEIDLYAAAVGPGSFTGLRIGLATVKAFAATTGRPCVGVPTLHAVAQGAGTSSHTLALLPAGRGELFAQLLSVESSGAVSELTAPTHIKPQGLFDKIKGLRSLKWAGEGAHLQAEAIRAAAQREGISFSLERPCERSASEKTEDGWTLAASDAPLAESVAALAWHRFCASETLPAEELRALYVRPTDAELKDV